MLHSYLHGYVSTYPQHVGLCSCVCWLWVSNKECPLTACPADIESVCPRLLLCSSRRETELGCKQADKQKRAIESSLSALRGQEEEARLSLNQVKEEVQRDKQQLHQLKSELRKKEKQALKYVTQCTAACCSCLHVSWVGLAASLSCPP